jgi:hypothetical protein
LSSCGGGSENEQERSLLQANGWDGLAGVHQGLGYNGASIYPADIARAANVLAEISRNEILWFQIESVQGVRDWTRPDAFISQLVAAGIEPLMTIFTSPQWANGSSNENAVPTTEPAFTTWVNNYVNFVTAVVARYKTNVHKWELWNEPNLAPFWFPTPSVSKYVTWYNAVRAAILAEDPTAQIAASGGSGGCCVGSGNIGSFAWVDGLIAAGITIDYLAIHPYATQNQAPNVTNPFENNFTDVSTFRQKLVASGRLSTPIWITEVGWWTAPCGPNPVSEVVQAEYLVQAMSMVRSQFPYVTVFIWFMLNDGGPFCSGLYSSTGVIQPSGQSFKEQQISAE